VLGGVEIPDHAGLLGHSDADVLVHAICDAILGTAALGDLGKHFPDTDPKYKGISSIKLLERVIELAANKGVRPTFIDSVVICELPKLAPYIEEMCANIADAAGVSNDQVSVKAKTTEHLGFTGRKEGIAAIAVVSAARDTGSRGRDRDENARNRARDARGSEIEMPATIIERAPGSDPEDEKLAEMLRGLSTIICNTDGATSGNPGPSGCAAVLMTPDGDPVCAFRWHIGVATNNIAEYTAALELVRWLDGMALYDKQIEINMDSELAVKQLNGLYKVKSAGLRDLWAELSGLLLRFKHCKVVYVRREMNTLADKLAKLASKKRSSSST